MGLEKGMQLEKLIVLPGFDWKDVLPFKESRLTCRADESPLGKLASYLCLHSPHTGFLTCDEGTFPGLVWACPQQTGARYGHWGKWVEPLMHGRSLLSSAPVVTWEGEETLSENVRTLENMDEEKRKDCFMLVL
nr:uncharacterized protein LOC105722421 [Aotus nancymaae]